MVALSAEGTRIQRRERRAGAWLTGRTRRVTLVPVALTALMCGVLIANGGFGIHSQLGVSIDATGVLTQFGFGFGGSSF